MFDKIKSAMTKGNTNNSKYKDIIKLEPGNVYTVRLIPNVKSPEKTLYKYYTHAWESFATGNYISAISPTTWGQRDPIAEARYTMSKHGSDEEKGKASKIIRRENWLANVYVVNDPKTPENNKQVKLLRFGRQLHKIILSAIDGEDSQEFGSRIFDLSPNGCNFKIKAESQGEYPTYVSSRFSAPSKIEGLPDELIESIYQKANDLESVFPAKSYDELKSILEEHIYCNKLSPSSPLSNSNVDAVETVASRENTTAHAPSNNIDPLDDDKVKSLLEGLNG